MNRVARATCWSMWTAAVFVLVACAARVTPQPSPTFVVSTPSATREPTTPPTVVRPSPTLRRPTATPVAPSAPHPTSRRQQFDDVDDRARLSALFPDLKLAPFGDEFRVNGDPNWTMWINSTVEGRFTQDQVQELAAIIVNDAPALSADQARRYAPWGSFLAIFQRQDGKLMVAQRAYLFPTAISPQAFDVVIEAATDFDHDGQDELLITTAALRLGVSTAAAFLYLWDDQTFVAVWSSSIAEDNTSALNQTEYYSIESQVRLADGDSDGMDEIIVDSTRVEFARDALGLADIDRETARRSERRVYRWGGAAFVLDPARTTPIPARVP